MAGRAAVSHRCSGKQWEAPRSLGSDEHKGDAGLWRGGLTGADADAQPLCLARELVVHCVITARGSVALATSDRIPRCTGRPWDLAGEATRTRAARGRRATCAQQCAASRRRRMRLLHARSCRHHPAQVQRCRRRTSKTLVYVDCEAERARRRLRLCLQGLPVHGASVRQLHVAIPLESIPCGACCRHRAISLEQGACHRLVRTISRLVWVRPFLLANRVLPLMSGQADGWCTAPHGHRNMRTLSAPRCSWAPASATTWAAISHSH